MLAGSIANGKLANSKVTIAGNDVSLGGSLTADTLRTSLGLSNAMHFKGTTTTTMSDGLTTAAVTIGGSSYTPSAGDVVLYSDAEFVWTGSAWERLGRDSSFKTT
jgi:selenocysteine lyase/cysteine desulfurase